MWKTARPSRSKFAPTSSCKAPSPNPRLWDENGRSASEITQQTRTSGAGADEVAVAVAAVDAADGRPVLVGAQRCNWVGGALAGVRMRPLVAQQHRRGVRRVLQQRG